jgi:ABC-type uncharacterized transport system fused permease/ATPase subunit
LVLDQKSGLCLLPIVCVWQDLFSFFVFFSFSIRASWFVTLWTTFYVVVTLPAIQWLSRPIVPASYAWRAKEGDLRFAHARQREYCEAVAFYGGQEEERCAPLPILQ